MKKEDLIALKKELNSLTEEELVERNLYLRGLANGDIQGPPVGYPSIDKPWLKYYKEDYIKAKIPHDMTALDYLKMLNKDNLELQAIDSVEGAYTYGQLFDMIDSVACSLYQMGIHNGNKVLMMLPPISFESMLFYAVDKVGGAISEVPIQTTLDDIINKINKLDMDMFFVSDFLMTPEFEQEIYKRTNLKNIVVIGNVDKNNYDSRTMSWSEFIEYGKGVKIPEIKRNPKDILFIASTGGSTGEPKSVMLNDECFNIAVHQYLNSDLAYDRGDRWLRLWSLFSATAVVSNNHLPLCAGMNSIIRPFPININDFDKIVFEEKSDHMMLIPQLLDVMEKSNLFKKGDLENIKTVGCGGLAITPQFEERVNTFFKNHNINTFLGYGWGCTENSTSAAMRSNFETTKVGTVGAPQVNTVVAVFDPETLEEKTYGEEGELCIKSYTQMMGYYEDEKMTNSVLKNHGDGTVWLHTGDLGSIDENGIVKVNGRMTRTIFVFPTAKVYPTAVEAVISKVPGVAATVVGEIPDKEHDGFGIPICFVIPEENKDLKELESDINSVCEVALADYARPKNVYFLEEMPLTKVGKPDVRKLEEHARNDKSNVKIKKLK